MVEGVKSWESRGVVDGRGCGSARNFFDRIHRIGRDRQDEEFGLNSMEAAFSEND
jgi:hypothetical protein